MQPSKNMPGRRRSLLGAGSVATLVVLFLAGLLAAAVGTAQAATPTVQLNTADSFAILAGSAITNVPPSPITGDVGLSPAAGTFYAGLTCSEVDGTIYAVDATGPSPCSVNNPGLLTTAMSNLTSAYNDAAGRSPDATDPAGDNQLGGRTLTAGVYRFGAASTANLIGDLTLSGDASSVWIFQATSTLVTASASRVILTGGAQACNVFWQVSNSATLGTASTFRGTILAHDDISVAANVTVYGRLMAGAQANHAGAVTLIQDTIARQPCAAVVPTPSSSASPAPTGSVGTSGTGDTTGTGGTSSTSGTGATATTGPQVANVPSGAVETGDGSTSGRARGAGVLLAGAIVLAGVSGGAVAVARRRRRDA